MGAIHLIALGMGRLWAMVRSRLFKDQGSGSWAGFAAGAEAAARRRFGVEENITLPATGTLPSAVWTLVSGPFSFSSSS